MDEASSDSSRGGGCRLLEELLLVAGNLAVQVTYGAYTVFLHRVVSDGVDPLFLLIFANLATTIVLIPFAIVFEMKRWSTELSARLLAKLSLLSLGGTLFQLLMLLGIKKASPAIASAIPNLTPGLIFIIAAAVRFEKFNVCCRYSRAKIVGTLLCITGVTTMCFFQGASESETETSPTSKPLLLLADPPAVVAGNSTADGDWMLGCLYLLAGVLILSVNTVFQASTMVGFPAPLSLVVVTSAASSILTALLQIVIEGEISVGSSTMDIQGIAATVLLAGTIAGVCITFQFWCMIEKGPVMVATFSPIQTVTAVVISAVSLRRAISIESIAGMVLMFVGLYLVLWGKRNETFSSLVEADHDVVDGDMTQLPGEDVEKPLLLF